MFMTFSIFSHVLLNCIWVLWYILYNWKYDLTKCILVSLLNNPDERHETIQHTLTESFSSACSFNSDPFGVYRLLSSLKDTFWKRIHLLQGSWCSVLFFTTQWFTEMGSHYLQTKMTPSSKHDAGRISKEPVIFHG